jgi:hypothetical protein
MYTPLQTLELVQHNERTPTPVWHLAKSAGVSEKSLLHILGLRGIKASYDDKGAAHISKVDTRRLMGLEGEL